MARVTAMLAGGHAHAPARKLRSRRSFTRNAALGAAGIVTAQIAGGSVYLLWPNQTSGFGGSFTVSAASVPDVNGTPYRDTVGKFYLVHTEDGIQALYWKCVHLGCTVPWIEGEKLFHCPCHGSVYLYNGTRIAGPATRAMDAMPVEVDDGGNVAVDTNPNTLIERTVYSPEHAQPYLA